MVGRTQIMAHAQKWLQQINGSCDRSLKNRLSNQNIMRMLVHRDGSWCFDVKFHLFDGFQCIFTFQNLCIITHLVDSITISSCYCACHVLRPLCTRYRSHITAKISVPLSTNYPSHRELDVQRYKLN